MMVTRGVPAFLKPEPFVRIGPNGVFDNACHFHGQIINITVFVTGIFIVKGGIHEDAMASFGSPHNENWDNRGFEPFGKCCGA